MDALVRPSQGPRAHTLRRAVPEQSLSQPSPQGHATPGDGGCVCVEPLPRHGPGKGHKP